MRAAQPPSAADCSWRSPPSAKSQSTPLTVVTQADALVPPIVHPPESSVATARIRRRLDDPALRSRRHDVKAFPGAEDPKRRAVIDRHRPTSGRAYYFAHTNPR